MIAAVGVMLLVVLVLGFLSSGASFTPGGPASEPSAARVVDAPAQLRALTAPFPVRVPATPAGWRSNSVGTDDVAGRKAIRAGYQMHVPKPVHPAELIAVVASMSNSN